MGPYLGDFKEDETVHFIWDTNNSNGASITRATDGTVSVYKDNGVAQSVAGVTDTEDFDGLTGIHACTIDLSADVFYATGANYTVVLSAATIDGQTVNAVLAHFSIENRSLGPSDLSSYNLLQSTTIATLASQTSFTLTAGSTDNDAYNGCMAIVRDASVSTQKAVGLISDYVGGTKTVTLASDPGIFTMAVSDVIDIIAMPKQLPDAEHAAVGGLPTVDANNRIVGIQGTKNDFDDLTDYNPSSDTVEGALTYDELLRVLLAVMAGKSAGGGTATITFRDYADGKDRVTATVTSNGNRTAITLDGA
jgi:hypothetical protein